MSKEVLEKMSIDTLETMRILVDLEPTLSKTKMLHELVETKKHKDFPVMTTLASVNIHAHGEIKSETLEQAFANYKKLEEQWDNGNQKT